MRKRVILCVISDLVTDQRVNRSAMAIRELGWDVLVVGRQLPSSPAMNDRPYATKRFQLWFHKGPLFYASYNLRLLFFLLMNRFDAVLCNDLDTLPAGFIAARIRMKELVYDSHEYFTGVPELQERKITRGVWRFLERLFLPRVKYLFTVNESIADLYRKDYDVEFKVMRNVPMLPEVKFEDKNSFRSKHNLPQNKFIYILQGSGINIQRGAEEAVEAMQYLDAVLLIAGGGDVLEFLLEKVKQLHLEDKVLFRPRMPYAELMQFTHCADVGLTLDKDTNINYRFSLPNKLFEYIHAGIPVLASDLVEIRKIVEEYNIGKISFSHEPKQLAEVMKSMQDVNAIALWKQNLAKAAAALNWDKEKINLQNTFRNFD